jgi:hypothetical protein
MQRALTVDATIGLIASVLLGLSLAGCGSTVATTGSGASGTTSSTSSTSTTSTSTSTSTDTISISGTPATTVVAGQAYTFQPTATDSAGNTLSYSITNLPAWASFNASTGELTGTPTAAQAGTYADITIVASDSSTSKGLAAFTITVSAAPAPTPTTGTATLSWAAPTQNTDGSSLTDLAGYRVYYGTSADALTQVIDVSDVTTYVINGLSSGTYYFAVAAYSTAGTESALSETATKTI